MYYAEHPTIENIKLNELDKSEWIYYFLQPFYRIITFFGNLHMKNEQ